MHYQLIETSTTSPKGYNTTGPFDTEAAARQHLEDGVAAGYYNRETIGIEKMVPDTDCPSYRRVGSFGVCGL